MVLFAAACGEAETDAAPGSVASETAPDAAAAADDNAALLRSSDDPRFVEVLDVGDGSITTLDNAVAGDRPVLLWFWAPH